MAQFLGRKFGSLQNGRAIDGGGYTGIAAGKHPFGDGAFRVITVPHGKNIFDNNIFVTAGSQNHSAPTNCSSILPHPYEN